jgi:hypothetical protein
MEEESCSPHGSSEAKRSNRKGPGQDAPFKGISLVMYAILAPTRLHLPQLYHLPTVYSNFEFVSGLNH